MILSSDDQAIAKLLAGGVGILPTDTLYGIVASAANPQAVAKFYALKSRDSKPGTVIAANVDQLLNLGVSAEHLQKVKKFWPNSLSIETPLGPELAYLHQNTGRQGLRVVNNQRLQKLLLKTGPLVTSSANLPGEKPAATVKDAYAYFGDSVNFYVDGGDLSDRQPSTIAKITDDGIEVIRQGAVKIVDNSSVKTTS